MAVSSSENLSAPKSETQTSEPTTLPTKSRIKQAADSITKIARTKGSRAALQKMAVEEEESLFDVLRKQEQKPSEQPVTTLERRNKFVYDRLPTELAKYGSEGLPPDQIDANTERIKSELVDEFRLQEELKIEEPDLNSEKGVLTREQFKNGLGNYVRVEKLAELLGTSKDFIVDHPQLLAIVVPAAIGILATTNASPWFNNFLGDLPIEEAAKLSAIVGWTASGHEGNSKLARMGKGMAAGVLLGAGVTELAGTAVASAADQIGTLKPAIESVWGLADDLFFGARLAYKYRKEIKQFVSDSRKAVKNKLTSSASNTTISEENNVQERQTSTKT